MQTQLSEKTAVTALNTLLVQWNQTFSTTHPSRQSVVALCLEFNDLFSKVAGYQSMADNALLWAIFIDEKASKKQFKSLCHSWKQLNVSAK